MVGIHRNKNVCFLFSLCALFLAVIPVHASENGETDSPQSYPTLVPGARGKLTIAPSNRSTLLVEFEESKESFLSSPPLIKSSYHAARRTRKKIIRRASSDDVMDHLSKKAPLAPCLVLKETSGDLRRADSGELSTGSTPPYSSATPPIFSLADAYYSGNGTHNNNLFTALGIMNKSVMNSKSELECTPLVKAVFNSDCDKVVELVTKKADLEIPHDTPGCNNELCRSSDTGCGATALFFAAEKGFVWIMYELLKAGAKTNKPICADFSSRDLFARLMATLGDMELQMQQRDDLESDRKSNENNQPLDGYGESSQSYASSRDRISETTAQ